MLSYEEFLAKYDHYQAKVGVECVPTLSGVGYAIIMASLEGPDNRYLRFYIDGKAVANVKNRKDAYYEIMKVAITKAVGVGKYVICSNINCIEHAIYNDLVVSGTFPPIYVRCDTVIDDYNNHLCKIIGHKKVTEGNRVLVEHVCVIEDELIDYIRVCCGHMHYSCCHSIGNNESLKAAIRAFPEDDFFIDPCNMEYHKIIIETIKENRNRFNIAHNIVPCNDVFPYDCVMTQEELDKLLQS